MKQNVDVVRIRENSIQLNGWVIGKTPESVPEFQVTDGKWLKSPDRQIHPQDPGTGQ